MPWLKCWDEELFPILVYCRHLNCVDLALYKWLLRENPDGDVKLRYDDREEAIEITMAYAAYVPGQNPGYQEKLRFEKMRADGHVSASAELVRDPITKRIEYAEADRSRPLSKLIDSWVEGINWSVRKKAYGRRIGYGRGKTLLVYCDGLSGDFMHILRGKTIGDVLVQLSPDLRSNDFSHTVIVGWHPGWIGNL